MNPLQSAPDCPFCGYESNTSRSVLAERLKIIDALVYDQAAPQKLLIGRMMNQSILVVVRYKSVLQSYDEKGGDRT